MNYKESFMMREKIGERVRRIRKDRGWTKSYLSDLSGISMPTLIGLEKGDVVSVETIKKLEKVLCVFLVDVEL